LVKVCGVLNRLRKARFRFWGWGLSNDKATKTENDIVYYAKFYEKSDYLIFLFECDRVQREKAHRKEDLSFVIYKRKMNHRLVK